MFVSGTQNTIHFYSNLVEPFSAFFRFFIHSLNKPMWNTHSASGSVTDNGSTAWEKSGKNHCLYGA